MSRRSAEQAVRRRVVSTFGIVSTLAVMFGNTDLETQDGGTDCLKRGPLGIDARPQSRIPLHSWRPPLADDRAAILLESPLSFLRLGSFDPMSRGHVLGGVRTLRLSACWISFFTGLALFVTRLVLHDLGIAVQIRGRIVETSRPAARVCTTTAGGSARPRALRALIGFSPSSPGRSGTKPRESRSELTLVSGMLG